MFVLDLNFLTLITLGLLCNEMVSLIHSNYRNFNVLEHDKQNKKGFII
jgi:hypothetical protein